MLIPIIPAEADSEMVLATCPDVVNTAAALPY
ncbi:uncharacterized protein METZ01_LOCUS254588 [marine metagenome]|uniref:Uncharacterized protein n=1 Tax=marine metagenome TaxID=408172 RepID=A0A382IPL7_9ZZZZ